MNPKADQDAGLKIAALAMLWSLGYVVRPEIILSERRRTSSKGSGEYLNLTDVDVLGYTFGPLLRMEVISVDCGTGQRRSGMERVFWARGVMDSIGIDRAICVIGKPTEEEHRLAAHKLGVTLVSASDFPHLAHTVVGKSPQHDFEPYYKANDEWLDFLSRNQPSLGGYLLRENWTRDWDRIPVGLPGQLRRPDVHLNARHPIQQFGFLELATLVAIAIVRMAGHMALTQPDSLPHAVGSYVLGGENRARMIESLIRKVESLEAKTIQQRLPETAHKTDVLIPYFPELLDLTARLAANMNAARHIPRYIQAFQLARISGDIQTYGKLLGSAPDSLTTKLALDTIRYLRVSGELAADFADLTSGI